MDNLVPYTKSSKNSIVRADKFFNTKKNKTNVNYTKTEQSKNSSIDIILQIEKKVIKIDKLLKDSFALKKKQQKKSTIKDEQKEFEDKEKELEKKKPKKEPGVNLPTPPKMGFIDWIKNFVFNTILGFLTVRLMKFLPTLLKIYPVIIGAGEFLINVGGNILNNLVTFVDWGYKAVDATSGFIKNIGGEGLAKVFDNFVGAIDNVIEFAVIAALLTAGGEDASNRGGFGNKGGKRGYDSQGRRVSKNVQQRYERRFGRDQFVDRFGTRNLKNVATSTRRGSFQQGARNAFVGLAGKGGAKSILKFVRPLTKRLPIIGGLLDFGLSVALGEDPGRAAFKAIGATLVGALGAAIGSLAFGVGGIIGGIIGGIGGDALGGALYDMFFKGKKPTQKQGKTNKLAGGGRPVPTSRGRKPVTRTLKKKKSLRTLSFTPRKIKPGRSAGGEAKVQSVFPNPEKPAWWDPFGLFSGKKQEQQPQQKTSKQKTANPQDFLVRSNDIFGRAKGTAGKMISGFATYIIKSLLGDAPDELDYLNLSKGLNSFMQGIFEPGTLGFAGGGEVDARQFFQGRDYTKVIAKSVKESGSKEVDTIIRNLKNEMTLRPVGRDEMREENIRRGTEGGEGFEVGPAGSSGDKLTMARNLMRDLGLTADQAAGIVGNMAAESGVENARPQGSRPGTKAPLKVDGKTGYGLVQWTSRGRQQALADFARSRGADLSKPLSMDIEYQFFLKEFRGAYGNVLKQIKNAPDVKTASTIFMQQYEIPAGYKTDAKIMERYNMSKPIYDRLAKGEGKATEGKGTYISPTGISGTQTGKFKVIEYLTGDRNHPNFELRGHGLPSNYHDHIAFATVAEKENAKRALRAANINVGSEYRPGDRGYHGSNLAIDVPGAQWGGSGAIGSKEFAGSRKVRQVLGIGMNAPRFHGGPILKTGNLLAHKGEYVIDKDSVDLFGVDFIDSINRIENKAQLIAKAPSIIEKLKAISEYTDYENPNQEPQIVYVEVPVEVPVPIGVGGGGNVFISGGVNSTKNNMEQTLSQLA